MAPVGHAAPSPPSSPTLKPSAAPHLCTKGSRLAAAEVGLEMGPIPFHRGSGVCVTCLGRAAGKGGAQVGVPWV